MAVKKINANTFSADDLGDVKPKVLIGGKDEKKFIPNINASFFDDEFYFNLNRKGKTAVELTTNDEAKITGADTDDFYIDDSGRLKWDIVFSERPKNLTLEWDLKHANGIEFLYQGEPSEEEIHDECFKPDEVIGSYAVYCNKANNKYKTGKLSHIYRPFVIDADGKQEWATLLIEKGTLSITLPDEFMKSAKYPVRLDPTFGYTSAGGTQVYRYDSEAPTGSTYGAYAATAGQVITGFSVYAALVSAGSGNLEAAAYTVSSGQLSSRLGSSSDIPISSTTPGWLDSGTLSMEMSSATYGMAIGTYGRVGVILYQDNTYADFYRKTHGTDEALPASWSGTQTNKIVSMYVTYGEGGGTPSASGYYYMMNQ